MNTANITATGDTTAVSDRYVDTVVIGAGIAGLAVASALAVVGDSVLVVEATDRVGGRLRSQRDRIDGPALDLGASWCWPGERRVVSLAGELGVSLHDQHIHGDAMYDGPDGAVRLDGNPVDVPAYRFSQGADSLTIRLAEELTRQHGSNDIILLDTRAVSITGDPHAHRVTVHCTRSSGGARDPIVVSARRAVLALPPAIAVRSIDITPSLPRELAAVAAATPVWMGATTKVVIRYDHPFWRDDGLSGSGISHRGPLREVHDLSGPDADPAALFGFGSSVARPITDDEVLAQLKRMFGPRAAHPTALHTTVWQSTLPEVSSLEDYRTYGHPVFQEPTFDGLLHWVSTETSVEQPGHIEGALAAAERAVADISRR